MTFGEFIENMNIDQDFFIDKTIHATLTQYSILNNVLSTPNSTGGEVNDELFIQDLSKAIFSFIDPLLKAYSLQIFNFNDGVYKPGTSAFRQVCFQFTNWLSDSIIKILNRLAVVAEKTKKQYNNKEEFNNAIVSTFRNGYSGFGEVNTENGTFNISKSSTNDNTYGKWKSQLRWEFNEWYFEFEMDLVNKWLVVVYEY